MLLDSIPASSVALEGAVCAFIRALATSGVPSPPSLPNGMVYDWGLPTALVSIPRLLIISARIWLLVCRGRLRIPTRHRQIVRGRLLITIIAPVRLRVAVVLGLRGSAEACQANKATAANDKSFENFAHNTFSSGNSPRVFPPPIVRRVVDQSIRCSPSDLSSINS
jgi:hypothetical protein